MSKIDIPIPRLQIEFALALKDNRCIILRDALIKTVESTNLLNLDKELSEYVPEESLKALAKHGLRGELMFVVPCLLFANPRIIGYYRLLLGFSKKEFYSTKFGCSRFKSMEVRGSLSEKNKELIPDLCNGLIRSATHLIKGIGIDILSKDIINDLTILTLGPQLRGGANVKKGNRSILDVINVIHEIVKRDVISSSDNSIEIKNAAGRKVMIQFAPDPDIVIREEISNGKFKNIIAIEVKGGTDFSNIHNRVGEAEKSHQKARAEGYVECWTVVNVDRINLKEAHKESPSTNKFYRLSSLKKATGSEYKDFKDQIITLTGIRNE